jgi:uncharacterized membrane protein YeaQ/YmgE (transglycosylase-associated protein family)
MTDLILALLFFTLIGWITHKIMGRDGGILHFCFIGGAGCGLGAFLEFLTNRYTTTFTSAIALCVVCACITEGIIRRIKRKFFGRDAESFIVDTDGDQTFYDDTQP